MDLSWSDPTSVLSAAQLGVLVVAAIVAWRQVAEARRLREAQAEPFVVVDFEVESSKIYLVISNIGRTAARDVKLTFNPELTSSWDDDTTVPLRETKVFTDGITSLPPGKQIRALFDVGFSRDPKVYPDVYRVRTQFRAPALGNRKIKDEMVLDLGIYWNLLSETHRDLGDIHNQLRDILRELRKWTASGRGILTMSPTTVRRRNRYAHNYWATKQGPRLKRLYSHTKLLILPKR